MYIELVRTLATCSPQSQRVWDLELPLLLYSSPRYLTTWLLLLACVKPFLLKGSNYRYYHFVGTDITVSIIPFPHLSRAIIQKRATKLCS